MARDPVLIMDIQQGCISKQQKARKAGMESKGIRVHMKTKINFLVSGVGHDALKESGKCPCAVCCIGVGNNSIWCSECMLWVNKRYSVITKGMVADPIYVCHMCNGEARPIDGRTVTEVDVDDNMATFCYVGDKLDSGGGCNSAVAARCCVAWGKLETLACPGTSQIGYAASCMRPAFSHLCSTAAKPGEHIVLSCSGSASMPAPWSAESVTPKTEMKHLHIHYYRNLALRILRQPIAQMVTSCVKSITHFPNPDNTNIESLGKHGPNVRRLISVIAAWIALTSKTVIYCCC